MKIQLDQLIRSLSMGLDAVEGDYLGASTHHGPRLAVLCAAMGRHMGFTSDEVLSLSCCALLHDNALTEYILSEKPGQSREFNMRTHCILGQRNAEALPFPSNIEGLILYHHERADGNGPFRIKAEEIPLGAQLIALCDKVDVHFHLQRKTAADLPAIRGYITENSGIKFTPIAADTLLSVLDEKLLRRLSDSYISSTLSRQLPSWQESIDGADMLDISAFVRRVIDYKSTFTKHHSTQVANIAWQMANYYQYEEEICTEIYFAASLHDLGKLFIPSEILEKPGALTDTEFDNIKTHVWWTGELLRGVGGMEHIADWAANHHERLDGSGYPRKLSAAEQDSVSRLVACVDAYQAIGDARPYHPGRSHEETMAILNEMVSQGKLDANIVADIGRAMAIWPMGKVPPPHQIEAEAPPQKAKQSFDKLACRC